MFQHDLVNIGEISIDIWRFYRFFLAEVTWKKEAWNVSTWLKNIGDISAGIWQFFMYFTY